MARFYTIAQNNSFGKLDRKPEAGIGEWVIIEAKSPKHARFRAASILEYAGRTGDCPCCGVRWDLDDLQPHDEPQIYGEPVNVGSADEHNVFIHRLDGTITGGRYE